MYQRWGEVGFEIVYFSNLLVGLRWSAVPTLEGFDVALCSNFVVVVDVASCSNIGGECRFRDGSCSRFKGVIEVV